MRRSSPPHPRRNRWSLRRTVPMVVVAAAATGGLVAGCGGDPVARPADPVLAKGQDVHLARCAACHGTRGEGGTGKRLNGGAVTRDLPDPADHRRIVATGIAGTSMPAWEAVLAPEEIDAVVRYQREVLDALPRT